MSQPMNRPQNQQMTRADQIKPLLLASQRQITSLLQDEIKARKFMAASLVVASDPALNKCSPDSIVQALIGVAMSDLNIDKNIGHIYLVPYGDKVQLQVGYKGFIQLLFRAGWMVKAFPVYQCDQFHMEFDGWDNKVQFIPDIDSRNEGDKEWVYQNLRGIFVVARHADTKDEYSAFVNKTVIEKLRLNSPNQRASQWTKPDDKKRLDQGLPIGVWQDWYTEMAMAKAIKKLAKILPIGDSRTTMTISVDDKSESGKTVDYKATADSGVVIELQATEETDIFDEISKADNKEDLDAISPKIAQLPKDQQKAAKVAWMKRMSEVTQPVQAAKEPVPKKEPKNKADEAQGPAYWKQRIRECGHPKTLSELIRDEMPESMQIELDDEINMKFDSMRE